MKVSFRKAGHTDMVLTDLKKMNCLIAMLECGQMTLGTVMGTLVLKKDGPRVTGHWKKDRLEYGDYEGSDGSVRSGKWRGNWEFLEEGLLG